MSFVYILASSKDEGWYIGKTSRPLQERVLEHMNGYVKATQSRLPMTLAYFEEKTDRKEQKRE